MEFKFVCLKRKMGRKEKGNKGTRGNEGNMGNVELRERKEQRELEKKMPSEKIPAAGLIFMEVRGMKSKWFDRGANGRHNPLATSALDCPDGQSGQAATRVERGELCIHDLLSYLDRH